MVSSADVIPSVAEGSPRTGSVLTEGDSSTSLGMTEAVLDDENENC